MRLGARGDGPGRRRGIVGVTAARPRRLGSGARAGPVAKEKAMISSLVRRGALKRPRMLLVLPAAAAAAAALAACSSSGTSAHASGGSTTPGRGGRGRPEDREGRRRDAARQQQGLHALHVRPPTRPPPRSATGRARRPGRRSSQARHPGSRPRSPRSSDPTARPSSPSTDIRCTPNGDTSTGQAKGNGVNAFGGLWHEATASGSAAPAGNSSSGSGGGGSGY
jgi:hypothetical protein